LISLRKDDSWERGKVIKKPQFSWEKGEALNLSQPKKTERFNLLKLWFSLKKAKVKFHAKTVSQV